ncbi:c-type cytochrome [Magnetovibrio sp.]|uniref:c-type cytochrome n=1 Tax=Magnetovibrio sp. TaxID=2024836 RepID=UPI002F926FC4
MNKSILTRFAVLTGVLMSVSAASFTANAEEKPKRDPGKKIYMTKTCMACHGKDGRKAMLNYPNIAGQDEKYMVNQINYIISGKRLGSHDATGNPRAQGMQGALISPSDNKPRISKEEIQQVAAWLAKQPPADLQEPKTPLDPASVEAGKKLFNSKCKACHGAEGKKPLKGNPYVAGQKRDYLFIQMQDIKSKARQTPKSAGMYGIVKNMTDEQFATLADYLSQVDRNAGN